jgi:5-methylcytosine-specific restriction endonuclease McrA
MNLLQQPVLILNRAWQAVEETTVETALGDVFRGQKRAIDTDSMAALSWDEWVKLPVRASDEAIRTIHGPVRVPRVVVTAWAGMPRKRPKKNKRGVALRDKYVCGYTGKFAPDGNVDHVDPLGQGGSNEWENLTWSCREVNTLKGNRTPEQAGLRLIRKPTAPKDMPAMALIEPKHPTWERFCVRVNKNR